MEKLVVLAAMGFPSSPYFFDRRYEIHRQNGLQFLKFVVIADVTAWGNSSDPSSGEIETTTNLTDSFLRFVVLRYSR